MNVLYAIGLVICLVLTGCFRCTETKNDIIITRQVAGTEKSTAVCLRLSQLDSDTSEIKLSQNILIQLLSEDLRDTLHSLIVGNASTNLESYSVQISSVEPYGTRGIIVSVPDATSTFGAKHSYCFVASGYSWFVYEIPLAIFDITDRDGDGLVLMENTQSEFAIGIRDGMLCMLN